MHDERGTTNDGMISSRGQLRKIPELCAYELTYYVMMEPYLLITKSSPPRGAQKKKLKQERNPYQAYKPELPWK